MDKNRLFLPFLFFGLVLLLAQEASGQGRIYFSMNHSGNWDLWSVRSDGTDLRQLTRTPEDEHAPALSPDGKEVLFVDGRRTLWIMNIDGSDRREIPLPKGIYAQPSWAPDGQEIAFVKYTVTPSDQSEIWTLRREEGRWLDPKRVSTYPPMRLYPFYSPDGSMLAFTEFRRDERRGPIEEIGLFDLRQRTFRLLTRDRADSFRAVWSPGGDRLAYTSNKAGSYDVWVVSLKDGTERQLTRDPGYDGEPAWSPEGHEIAFISTRRGNKELWVMSATGDLARPLTKMGKPCKEPFWGK